MNEGGVEVGTCSQILPLEVAYLPRKAVTRKQMKGRCQSRATLQSDRSLRQPAALRLLLPQARRVAAVGNMNETYENASFIWCN